MSNNIDRAVAESLRNFALAHNEIAFAHLVTQALAGEEWAMERVRPIAMLHAVACSIPGCEEHALTAIRTTDTTCPDGAIARAFTF